MTGQPPRKILVVEDDDLLGKSLATFVTSLGYGIASARSAEEALDLEDLPLMDLCIVDYQLPGMSGLEFAETLRARDLHTPVLLMSGYLNSAIRIEAIRRGVLDVLHKPTDMKLLAQTLGRVLGVTATA